MLTETPLPDPLHSNLHWRSFQFLMQSFFCFWLQYRARGLEHLPAEGGALLVMNHQSYLDPLLAGLPLTRPVSYLARDSLFSVPILGSVLQNTYVIPINREAASTSSLREAIRRLDYGFYVGIFPEGTRTTDGTVGAFKPGFLSLVRRSSVPLVPVGIAGAFESYPKGTPLPLPGVVRVVFGEAISRTVIEQYGRGQDDALLQLVRQRIIACQTAAEEWRSGVTADA